MEFVEGRIVLDKELSVLDNFVLDFVRALSVNYVIVSGDVTCAVGLYSSEESDRRISGGGIAAVVVRKMREGPTLHGL